jgi:RimJ/RimL family protein N-acetyltransferase
VQETERLVLRRFRVEDAEAFAAYRSDPDVARFQSWDAPVSLAEAVRHLRRFAVADPSVPGWFQYAVEHRAEGVLIGDIGVRLEDNLMQAEIGYTFAPSFQGKGYATEAVRMVLDRLFATGIHRVSAGCDARNTASARLLERLGFRREGLRVEFTWIKGEWTDELLFGLLARDWAR